MRLEQGPEQRQGRTQSADGHATLMHALYVATGGGGLVGHQMCQRDLYYAAKRLRRGHVIRQIDIGVLHSFAWSSNAQPPAAISLAFGANCHRQARVQCGCEPVHHSGITILQFQF